MSPAGVALPGNGVSMGVSEWMFGRRARDISRILNSQGLRSFVLQTGNSGLQSHVVQVECPCDEGTVKLEFYVTQTHFYSQWRFHRWITRPSGQIEQLDEDRILPQTTGNRMAEHANAKPYTVVQDMLAIGLFP